MTEQIGHIKNPLTVISRFAAIAEISGTAVLPFISPENQATYIWFLMIFPVLLVGTFFLTLNFNHKTLYAPSDYKNQNHFLNLFGIVTPDERDEKLSAEVKEADVPATPSEDGTALDPTPSPPHGTEAPPVTNGTDHTGVTTPVIDEKKQSDTDSKRNPKETTFDFEGFSKRSHVELMAKIEYIEKRSIEKLKLSTNIDFSPKIKFEFPNIKKPILFDAIADKGDTIHIAEVKYFDKKAFTANRFGPTLSNAKIAAQHINQVSNRRIQLHLVVILSESVTDITRHNITTALMNQAKIYDVPCSIYIATVDQISSSQIPAGWLMNT